ncbi:PXA domain family protein [Candida albicans]|uniref:PXA domain family protein n=1 Tax=Candida albicans TaxID=5476 RepID=A0A8H6C3J2_CANAX|nr:PXA domain family protein [Candida albicans]
MNASIYLQSFGWKEGEALKKGGLKKPILVKHKKDTKGLGHDTNDSDMWWEKLFDGQLKNLEVNNNNKNGGVSFETNEEKVVDAFQKSISPLYKMFVKGEGLAGTVGKTDHTKESHREISSSKALEDMEKLTNKDTFSENIKDNASSSDEKDRNKKKKSEKKTKDGKEKKKKSKKKSKDGILSKEKKRSKSKVKRPIFSESFLISESLQRFIDLIIQEFISPWYTQITQSAQVQTDISLEFKEVIRNLQNRAKSIDFAQLLVSNILPLLQEHFEDYLRAEDIIKSQGKFSKFDSNEYHIAVASQFRRGKLHPAVTTSLTVNEETNLKKTIFAKENEEFLCNVINLLTESDFYNLIIVKLIGDNLRRRDQVKQLRAALEEHTQKCSKEIDDNKVQVPDMASALLTPDSNLQNQLKLKISERKQQREKQKSLNLKDILTDKNNFQVFKEFMESEGRSKLVEFWKAVEMIKAPLEGEENDDETDPLALSLEFGNNDDVYNIYTKFIKTNEIPQPDTHIVEVLSNSGNSANVRTYQEARTYLFKMQRDCFDQMQSHDLPVNSEITILEPLLRKAELTNNLSELKVLQKSKIGLIREINIKELQKQQFIVQENDNSLFGKSRVCIQSYINDNEKNGREFTLYIIEVQKFSNENPNIVKAGWVVARRFSQFYGLHEYLKSKYHRVSYLKFPKKSISVLKFQQKQVAEIRMKQLEDYLQELIKIQEVCSDRAFRSFLSSENFNLKKNQRFEETRAKNYSDTNFQSLFGSKWYRGISNFMTTTKNDENHKDSTYIDTHIMENLRDMESELKQFDEAASARTQENVLDLIMMLTNILFPNGKFKDPPVIRSLYQQSNTRQEAKVLLEIFIFETCSTIFGRHNSIFASTEIFSMIQNEYLNRNLVFEIFDEILEHMFVEMK